MSLNSDIFWPNIQQKIFKISCAIFFSIQLQIASLWMLFLEQAAVATISFHSIMAVIASLP